MSRFVLPQESVFNINGQPLPGATLDFHNVGLLTDKNTYPTEADAVAGTNPNPNPVIANASGNFGNIWIIGSYDVTLKNSSGTTIWGPEKVESFVSGSGTESIETKTTATMAAISGLSSGVSVVNTAEYSTGNGGGGTYDAVTVGTTIYVDLPDAKSVIVSAVDPTICFVLRKPVISAAQFGSIQAAIDYSIDNNFETIFIDRLFDQTGITLTINKGIIYTEGANDFARKRITFIGIGNGEIRKPDTGFIFSGASWGQGDIAFDNITFSGDVETEFPTVVAGLNCFDCDVVFRINTTNCTFRNFDFVWFQDGTTATPMQSIKSTNDTYTKNNVILQFNQAWDVVFNGGLMEDGNQFLACKDVNSTIRNLTVNNGCTVEGMIQTAIELNCINNGTKIINSYFEANTNHIQMNRFNHGVSVSNNAFLGRGNVPAGNTIICIDVAVGAEALTVTGNASTETTANTTLISIDETSAFNVSRRNIMGINGVVGSVVLCDVPNRYIDSGDVSNDTTRGIESGITADVSGVQGGGLLTATINEISTCANAGDSVTLLTAVSGLKQTIINNGANACDVFPNTSDNLGAGTNAQVSLAAGANITYVCWDFATNWVALT